MIAARVAAVDLGASSGRVYAADFAGDRFALAEVGRFANGGVRLGSTLYWDLIAIYRGLLDGVGRAGRQAPLDSIGIDSWAVDYGLLRADGTLASNPVHHRDPRSGPAFTQIVGSLGAEAIYARTGVALQPFNTLYQLATDARAGHVDDSTRALLIPDLLSYFLCGSVVAEQTNASTTQLLGLDGEWDEDLIHAAGLPRSVLPVVIAPGTRLGQVERSVLADLGVEGPVGVHAVASHDTASAVVAVPAEREDFAFISCGTWSLVGVELESPIVNEATRQAMFTNERGIDSTVRFLRNVMGLWLLQECVRTWEQRGRSVDLVRLNEEAAGVSPMRSVIDVNDAGYLPPGDMPARIAEDCRRRGQPVPVTPAEITRCIIDSLVVAYRRAVGDAEALTGRTVSVIHLVGGGVHNALLCQLTADGCGVPVVAGPVEAAALGNALVQARALGAVTGDRWAIRSFVRDHTDLTTYSPRPG